ncbi:15270_t:CDS:1 [Acaulospora morrowiae]|uniref:15270_t:CDS:1 n=1 Tax=Acaulospora morrowiae TaxID=94023 RepID=A0A9N8V4D7_9GLOM|nr:15270_t:CDS:1 [Acaulospora morrowiae]
MGYSTPSNEEDSLSSAELAEPQATEHSSSLGTESSHRQQMMKHDPILSPAGQFVTPPEQYEEIPFHRYSEESNPYFLDDLDELTSKKQISELQKTLEKMQASIPLRRVNEIEKALERLQAEVSASHERIEGLKREMIEREKKRRKRSWSWLFWVGR